MGGTDSGAMRALTHPLRLDLLELLAANGPATAAGCGRALGVAQANCSFHLRQLAKYGYVQEAEQGTDKRERRWRLTEPRPSMRFGPGSDAIVRRRLERLVVERETQAILDHVDSGGDPDPQHSSAGILAALVTVTAEQAAELKRKWRELIDPFLVTPAPVGAAPQDGGGQPERSHARVFMALTPMASITGTDQGEGGHEHEYEA
jgi:DNA-binding transcriptional ArsR family regulator